MRATLGVPVKSVVSFHDPGSVAAEAYRVLRTNLQFLGLDQPLKSVVITSSTPGEGKSTTAANLAVSFAQAGQSVCLVDADLRRPTVAKVFGVENWAGLTTALVGQADVDACLREGCVEGLTLLTSGPIPPNPSELLGSNRMTKLVAELERRFDMVIFDTPPVLAVTDAALLSPGTGGALLVVRSGKVDYRQVSRAKVSLETVKARILGVVLSAVPADEKDGYYYYYQSEQR